MRLSSWIDGFRGLPGPIYILAAARFANALGFAMATPFLSLHVTQRAGASLAAVGAFYTASAVGGALVQVLVGELADRFGTRRVVVAALLLRVLVMAGFGLAVTMQAGLPVFGGLIIFSGTVRGAFDPAAQAQASSLVGPGQRAAAFGLQRVGISLGWVIGPAIGGLFAARSFGVLFFGAAALTTFMAAACATIRDPARSRAQPSGRPRWSDLVAMPRPREFIGLMLATAILAIASSQLVTTVPVFAVARAHVTRKKFGLLLAVTGTINIVFQSFAVRQIDRFGLRRALTVAALITALGYGLIGWSEGILPLGLAVIVVTAGELITKPGEPTAAVALGDPGRPGRSLGLYGLVKTSGSALGPVVGGWLYDHSAAHPWLQWLSIAAIAALAAGAYLRVGRPEDLPIEFAPSSHRELEAEASTRRRA